jgi:hypothetical protein
MSTALGIITRGLDSSGRPVKGTRQNFQFFDRLNDGPAQGLLVIVQGSWSFADASAGTHGLAMCMDYRTWNLTALVREATVRAGRDLMGTMWYRTEADGFDPHIHNNLIGDAPATSSAAGQVRDYRLGLNGLANRMRDRNPYRPKIITNYKYLEEDDMFSDADRARMERIEKTLKEFKTAEWRRDKEERLTEKERFSKLVTAQGKVADQLTLIMNRTKDAATKKELKKLQEAVLLELKNDPDVTQQDNPSDEGLAERNMG